MTYQEYKTTYKSLFMDAIDSYGLPVADRIKPGNPTDKLINFEELHPEHAHTLEETTEWQSMFSDPSREILGN